MNAHNDNTEVNTDEWRGEIGFQAVAPGQKPALVAAYRQAHAMAEARAGSMRRAGLAGPAVLIVPSLKSHFRVTNRRCQDNNVAGVHSEMA
jgi:hypothetical protein